MLSQYSASVSAAGLLIDYLTLLLFQVTSEKLCRAQHELHFQAATYLCLLRSIREHVALHQEFHGKGERSVEESAGLVGLKLPQQPGGKGWEPWRRNSLDAVFMREFTNFCRYVFIIKFFKKSLGVFSEILLTECFSGRFHLYSQWIYWSSYTRLIDVLDLLWKLLVIFQFKKIQPIIKKFK